MHYIIHLRKLVGEKKANYIIRNAVFVLSMGTNDFLQNYYIELVRSKQFTVQQYQDFLVSSMSRDIKVRACCIRAVSLSLFHLPLAIYLINKYACLLHS